MEMAITIDDLPHVTGAISSAASIESTRQMLAILKSYHLEGIYGFMNGKVAQDNPEHFSVLQEWITQGQLLANHSFSHYDYSKTNLETFCEDIKKNEPLLKKLMGNKNYHYFRYPYLSEGETQKKYDNMRTFLFTHQYQVVPVTIDLYEYKWNLAYLNCLAKNKKQSIAWLAENFISNTARIIKNMRDLSMRLLGRDIKHILLLHISPFSILMMDKLFELLSKLNVVFISLPEALSDTVYQMNPDIVSHTGCTLLCRLALANQLDSLGSFIDLGDTPIEKELAKL